MGFNMPAKVLTGLAVVTFLVAVIVYVLAGNSVQGAQEDVTFEAENVRSFTVNFPADADMLDSYMIWIEGSPSDNACEVNSCDVTHVASGQVTPCDNDCNAAGGQGSVQQAHDPVLQDLCTFTFYGNLTTGSQLLGEYQVDCTVEAWAVHLGDFAGEIATGILGGIGLAAVSCLLAIVGSILSCIACCCCCMDKQQEGGNPSGGGVVIGQQS